MDKPRRVCQDGANKMPGIIAHAPGDIRFRLWTLYWLVRMTRQTGHVVELGVRRGDTCRALLAACEDCGSDLTSYDIEDVGQHVRDVTKGMGIPWFEANWQFCLCSSIKGASDFFAEDVDLVFVDTDHTLATTRAEIAAWCDIVRKGGVMAFHDYWNTHPGTDGVKQAVDEFADSHPQTWRLETYDKGPDGDVGFALLFKEK